MSTVGNKRVISTPLSDEVLRDLRVGDVFYLTGLLATARDRVHERIVVWRLKPPIDLRGYAVMHAGPIVAPRASKLYCLSLGSTTSARFEKLIPGFMEATGVRLVIGKGGVSRDTARSIAKLGGVYAVFPGGCGALGASSVDEVLGVYWEDLGSAEALWVLRVRELGPLIVAVDSEGGNLVEDVLDAARASASSSRRVE